MKFALALLALPLFAQTDFPGPLRAGPKADHSANYAICSWDEAQAFCAGLIAPATGLTADAIWTTPSVDGSTGQVLGWVSAYTLGWISPTGAFTVVSIDPSGACTAGQLEYNSTNGVGWGCKALTWTPIQPADMATTDTTQSITGTKTFTSIIEDSIKFASANSTSAVAGVIGATCPAITCTSAYTWVKAVAADGSTVYFPVWK